MDDTWEDEVESLEELETEEVPDLAADWTDTFDDLESDAWEEALGLDQDILDPFNEDDWSDEDLEGLEEGYFSEEDFWEEPAWFDED